MNSSKLRKVTTGLLVLVVVSAVGFWSLGGKTGVMLLAIKYFIRTDYQPGPEVQWAQAPALVNSGHATKRPNIVLIVADDLGFNDITLHGGGIAKGTVPTPNIDSIAKGGVDFLAGYSGNATCAPSRAAMMTGRYPTRFGFEFTPTPKQFMKVITSNANSGDLLKPIYHAEREADLIPYEDMGLPTTEVTLARALQNTGYRTLHLGKWHLGDSPQFRPYAHGFDESLSLQHAASMFLPENAPKVVNAKQEFDLIDKFLWAAHPWGIRFNAGEPFQPPRYMTDYLTDEALKAIDANKQRPFFMFLAYNAPHTPLQSTQEDYDALPHITDHTTRVYAAMIRSLDRNVGRVLKHLKDNGLEENTLIMFTSDNGGAHYIGVPDLNQPYRGWKATFYEGGIRVPFFMKWPQGLPKAASYKQPISHLDIFSTALAAAAAPPPEGKVLDGVNLLPFVRGEKSNAPHSQIFFRTHTYLAMRQGDWKLQVMERPQQDVLYNLAKDPGERINLAEQEPARLLQMKKELQAINAQQIKPLWPSLGEGPIRLDKTLKQAPQPGDAYIYYAN
jgi:arylsulfatase A-like enzyme